MIDSIYLPMHNERNALCYWLLLRENNIPIFVATSSNTCHMCHVLGASSLYKWALGFLRFFFSFKYSAGNTENGHSCPDIILIWAFPWQTYWNCTLIQHERKRLTAVPYELTNNNSYIILKCYLYLSLHGVLSHVMEFIPLLDRSSSVK